MTTAYVPVAERLSTTWGPRPDGRFDVVICEHKATKDVPTAYLAERGETFDGNESWLFCKLENNPDGEVYETWVTPDGHGSCSCRGAACRNQSLTCRHRLAVLQGREQGVI